MDPSQADATLQSYADTIRSRVRGSQPQALLAHMHDYLFEELKFTGNTTDYYNPANSYLPSVLETKLGLPITLSMVYKMVAQRLGFRSWGVGLPGHFLAGIEVDGESMLIDPFAGGRVMTPTEAHSRMQEIFGPDIEWSDELLQPASNRHWLTRMLQNLLNIFGSNGQYHDVAAMLEMEILLWPEQTRLQRDLALVLARIGLSEPASAWLNRYLQSNPDDPQCDDLKQLLEVLEA
jgi:regulator of sirC expression with transglutaminase-like and TPR domain